MNNDIFFIKSNPKKKDHLLNSLKKLLVTEDLFSFIKGNDLIAIKSHFGENRDNKVVTPEYIKTIGDNIYSRGALPFLTETTTLYKGNRSNAVNHLNLAYNHGFNIENTGMPVIIADGLFGDEETEIKIKGKLYSTIKIASQIAKANGLIMISHFTGHLAAGFGATIKNMGMGCVSRKGKMIQHSTSKPVINKELCTLCKECIKWCPVDAIDELEDCVEIDSEKCIGCGQCLTVCNFDAVEYNWGATYKDLQMNIAEHALGVKESQKNKIIYINFLTDISKDCDCMSSSKQIVDDIGILVSFDPVAIDKASIDLVEQKSSKKISSLAYDIPYETQLDYGEEIGLGNKNYNLIEV